MYKLWTREKSSDIGFIGSWQTDCAQKKGDRGYVDYHFTTYKTPLRDFCPFWHLFVPKMSRTHPNFKGRRRYFKRYSSTTKDTTQTVALLTFWYGHTLLSKLFDFTKTLHIKISIQSLRIFHNLFGGMHTQNEQFYMMYWPWNSSSIMSYRYS